jgi:enamine deaminase RidA (YjgF/YER057c/UK114 family)
MQIVSTPNALRCLPTFCEYPNPDYIRTCDAHELTLHFLSSAQAVISNGHVYVTGNIGLTHLTDATDFKFAEGGVKEQVVSTLRSPLWAESDDMRDHDKRVALENLSKVLKASGSGLEHIVKVGLFLTDMQGDFDSMNEVFVEVCSFGPARSVLPN